MNSAPRDPDPFVSATEIAGMFFCEQKVVLDSSRGERVTERQAAARQRGNRVHRQVDESARRDHNQQRAKSEPGNHCFIATHVYGYDDERTWELRRMRDQVFMRHRPGRCFVKIYYKLSPRLVSWLDGREVATAIVRALLDLIRHTAATRIGGNHEQQSLEHDDS